MNSNDILTFLCLNLGCLILFGLVSVNVLNRTEWPISVLVVFIGINIGFYGIPYLQRALSKET